MSSSSRLALNVDLVDVEAQRFRGLTTGSIHDVISSTPILKSSGTSRTPDTTSASTLCSPLPTPGYAPSLSSTLMSTPVSQKQGSRTLGQGSNMMLPHWQTPIPSTSGAETIRSDPPSVTDNVNVLPKSSEAKHGSAAQGVEEDVAWDGTGPEAKIWKVYLNDATKFDRGRIDRWNRSIDVILLFATLFSAILTAFVIEAYKNLNADTGDVTVEILKHINANLERNLRTNAGNSVAEPMPPMPAPYKPSSSVVRINCSWFASLTLSLGVTVVAVLAKQWLDNYDYPDPSGSTRDRARLRQYRYTGLLQWKVPDIIALLPSLLLMALGLFFWGLIEFLWGVNTAVAIVATSIIAIIALFFISTTVSPLFSPRCAYKTPASSFFRYVAMKAQHLWRRKSILMQAFKASSSSLESEIEVAHIIDAFKYVFGADSYFSFSHSAIRRAEKEHMESVVDTVDMQAFMWLVETSPSDARIEAAIRAAAELLGTEEQRAILRSADILSAAESQLFFLLHDNSTPFDVSMAGACARNICLSGLPSRAVLAAFIDRVAWSRLKCLLQHTDPNAACYINCLVLRMLTYFLDHGKAALASNTPQKLQSLFYHHARKDITLDDRAVIMLLATLNMHAKYTAAFKYHDDTIAAAMDILTSTPSVPDDLARAIVMLLELCVTPALRDRPYATDSRSTSDIALALLKANEESAVLSDREVCVIITRIPGKPMNGTGSSDASSLHIDKNVYGVIDGLFGSGKILSDELCSAMAGLLERLASAPGVPKILREKGFDRLLALTLSNDRSEKVWIDVCSCLKKLSVRFGCPYGADLSRACLRRLEAGARSAGELHAILALLMEQRSAWKIVLSANALSTLAHQVRQSHGGNPLVFEALAGLTMRVLLANKKLSPAEIIADSGLLEAVSERVGSIRERFGGDPITLLDIIRAWADFVAQLCLAEDVRPRVLQSRIMTVLMEEWDTINAMMVDKGLERWSPPWDKDLESDAVLDLIAARARETKSDWFPKITTIPHDSPIMVSMNDEAEGGMFNTFYSIYRMFNTDTS